MTVPLTFPLFSGYGIELEYIIVDRQQLSILPIADQCLDQLAGSQGATDAMRDGIGWSNEFVRHVIELKNSLPQNLICLPEVFQQRISEVNQLLSEYDACLMPTAMHPWMEPATQTHLWTSGDTKIYDTYQKIFDCATHGWANLQSMHINLPFTCDADFARLHAAVRLVLPILPALAASSPIADGRVTKFADYRMEVYRNNANDFPMIAGQVIPEPVTGQTDHHTRILQPMFDAITPYDPEQVLRHEWLNSRGAIPRFDRNAIEIRVADMQECPLADLAIAAAVTALVKHLYYSAALDQKTASSDSSNHLVSQDDLVAILLNCIRDGDRTLIQKSNYLALIGYPRSSCTAQELWHYLFNHLLFADIPEAFHHALDVITVHGNLSTRIRQAAGDNPLHTRLTEIYRNLCECLEQGLQFKP